MDQLISKARNGDNKSFVAIVDALSRDGDRNKVKLMASKTMRHIFNSYCIDKNDLEQEINLAIWESILGYDPNRGEFKKYAWVSIRNKMSKMKRVFIEKLHRVDIDFDVFPPKFIDERYDDVVMEQAFSNLDLTLWQLANLINLGFSKRAIRKAMSISKEKFDLEVSRLSMKLGYLIQGDCYA